MSLTGMTAVAARGDLRSRLRLPALNLRVRATSALVLGLVSIAAVAWLAYDQAAGMSAGNLSVSAHRQVAQDAQALMIGLVDEQTGLRAYQAGGEANALGIFATGETEAAAARSRLSRHVETVAERRAGAALMASSAAWENWAESQVAQVPAADLSAGTVVEGSDLFQRFRSDDASLVAVATGAADAEAAALGSRAGSTSVLMLTVAGCSGLILFLMAYLAHWQFLRPVRRLGRTAADLAADLDVEVPYTDRQDEIGALAAALLDWRYVTAERLAVAKLAAESDARFKTVFERAPIGIGRLAMGGRILDANPMLREMLGYQGDALLRLSLPDVVHRRDRDRLMALHRQHTDRFVMETRLLKPDGTIFWGLITGALQRLEDGRPLFYVVMVEDINERKRQETELQHQVSHDALTGIANRRHFLAAVDTALSDRRSRSTAIFVIDLDGFKDVNDRLGHAAGDEVLRQVSARMSEVMRNSDLVARLGGDEFAVLLPGTDREGADVAARKLLAAFQRPFQVEGQTVRVGASLGISLAPEHARETANLIERADLAMYRAKRAGGGVAMAA